MASSLLTRHPPAPPPAAQVEPILVNVVEAARLLSISDRLLTDPTWSDVPRIRRGGRVLFSVAALREWVAREIDRQAGQDGSGAGG